ncbi:MAG TPA: asparagine synthase (glutamine-hydrolyzing) [Terriglobales bacterium]|nr:asparagine synthase (glutamine-hydrolyzing) [Terriglobales bacterium]
MCGIAGFWLSKPAPEPAPEILERMACAIEHRGPDDAGYLFEASSGIGLAHRRLSILDLSAEGHQPMESASGRYVIIFNGEVYNFQEIASELGELRWRGHSDTEVMLEAIERWGLDAALQRFIGMFAFALWDRQERKLYLVRDRLGIKPLYYGNIGGNFVFASELKSLREFPGFVGEIDRNALALFMRHDCIPAPHCIYQGISKLAPGSILTLDSASSEPRVHTFWSAAEVARAGINGPHQGSEEKMIAELRRTLASAVKLRMISDVPLGAFLSGGIDSSLVVALMQAQSSRPVQTFTIGFKEGDYNEASHARRVAQHLGTDHTELYVTPQQTLDVVPLLPSMYDEPFADSSQIPTYLVSKLARSKVTVSLSGDGGDELFGGYNRYLFTRSMWNRIKLLPYAGRKLAAAAISSIGPRTFDGAYSAVRPLIPSGKRFSSAGDKAHRVAEFLPSRSPQEIYLRALSHWQNPEELVLGATEPVTVRRVINESNSLPSLEEQMMLSDQRVYLPDDILTKVDRASMAVSLEARVPILDHHVVEFAWKLPLDYKIRNGVSKWALRQVLYQHVPQELFERPKMGFAVPLEHWLRGPLRSWAEERLSEESLSRRQLLNVAAIRKKWQEHLSGTRNWQYLLWNVLVFQDWYEHSRGRSYRKTPLALAQDIG